MNMPIMLNVRGLPCLVVGGGKIALRKTLTLLRFEAEVTVVAPSLVRGLRKLAARGLVQWRNSKFRFYHLLGKKLVVASTDDPEINHNVSRWARRLGLICNCVDDPAASDFIFPAICFRPPLAIAVSTQGVCPAAARRLKRKIDAEYGRRYQAYVNKLGAIRTELKTREPDPERRYMLIRRLTNMEPEKLLDLAEESPQGG